MSNWEFAVAEDPASADGKGEDRWLFYEAEDGTVWAGVIDGASTQYSLRPTGGEYAEALAASLLTVVSANTQMPPVTALSEAIARTVAILNLPQPSAPSAAVGLVRWAGDEVTAASLGDVTIAWTYPSGDEGSLRDARLGQVAKPLRTEYKSALKAGRGYDDSHNKVMRSIRETELAHRNTKDGYWIAADLPAAALEAQTLTLPEPPELVVLASDGGACAKSKYALFQTWQGLASSTLSDAAAVCSLIRAAEASDPKGQRWPRSKPSDDIAIVALRRDSGGSQPD